MRITIPITACGERWHAELPRIDLAACYPLGPEPAFDEAAFRAQVRDCRQIQMSSKDCGNPCAFAAILLSSLGDWMADTGASVPRADRTAQRLQRRETRDQVTYVRVNIVHAAVPYARRADEKPVLVRGIRVGIQTDDRDGTVVQVRPWEREFALVVADFVRAYNARWVRRGDPPIALTDDTRALLEELHDRTAEEATRQSNERRLVCANHRNGYCSPCNPACKHFKNGKCEEI